MAVDGGIGDLFDRLLVEILALAVMM